MKLAHLSLVSLLVLAPAVAAARGPSTPAERRRAVELTRLLERDPLAAGSEAARAWLLGWVKAIPDIEVQSCPGPLDALQEDEDGTRYGPQLYSQSVFGMAAYLAERPGRKAGWVAVQTAGIESVLRAYRAVLAAEPGARWPELDRLVVAGRQGTLARLVEQTMRGCGDEAGRVPAGTI